MIDQFKERLILAKEVAVDAGRLAVKMRATKDQNFVSEKGHQDFVTVADLAVEDLIRKKVSTSFPDDNVLGEERGATTKDGALWIIDPIDGTTNYMRGLSDWAVSIAFCNDGEIQCGAVYAPDIDTLVWAGAGMGAFMENREVSVSARNSTENALVLLGRSGRRDTVEYLRLVHRMIDNGLEYRRNGSAAFSLMMVALGRADAFYEAHLNSWDAMAGILLMQEAGGKVDHPPITEFVSEGGAVFASNPQIHEKIQPLIDDRGASDEIELWSS